MKTIGRFGGSRQRTAADDQLLIQCVIVVDAITWMSSAYNGSLDGGCRSGPLVPDELHKT